MARMPLSPSAKERARIVWGSILLLLLISLPRVAVAQSAAPGASVDAPADAPTTFQRSVTRSNPAQAEADKPKTTGPEFSRILLALGVVIAIIFAFRWATRRIVAGPNTARSSRAIQVVSRSIIAPKQQLMLVQIGRRLVLVGNCGTTMSPLCEIRDDDEVTQVLAQVQAEKSESISRAFSSLFRRETEKYAPDEAEADDLSETSSHDAKPASQSTIDPDDPIATTRQELHELLDKVRGMSRQFDK